MGLMSRGVLLLAVLLAVTPARPLEGQRSRQPPPKPPTLAELGPLNAPQLLDVYLAGRFEEALQPVRAASDDAGPPEARPAHTVTLAPFLIDRFEVTNRQFKAFVDEVLLRVEETFAFENAERRQIADGMPIDEVYRTFGVL